MAEFDQFARLPKELRYMIWYFAAVPDRRVINLDVHLEVSVSGNPFNQPEYFVFGGHFKEQLPHASERDWHRADSPVWAVTPWWPASSEETLNVLLQTCRDSREVVLRQYPDFIVVQPREEVYGHHGTGRPPHPPPRSVTSSPTWNTSWNRRSNPAPQPWERIRCNLKRDIIYIRHVHVNADHITQSDIQFALSVWSKARVSPDGARQTASAWDEFRRTLGRIKHLMINGRRLDTLFSPRYGPAVCQLFSATPNLETLYVCPWAAVFADKSYTFSELPERVFKGEVPAGFSQSLEEVELAGKCFSNTHRFRGPLCHTVTAREIVDLCLAVPFAPTSAAHRRAVFQALLARGFQADAADISHGDGSAPRQDFVAGQVPLRVLPVRLRSTKTDSDGEDDAVWLPESAGWVCEKPGDGGEPSMSVKHYE